MSSLRILFAVVSALILCQCSSFENEWAQSVADYQSGRVTAPFGPWQGNWSTITNNHTGGLRAIVKPSPKKDHYAFRYHATWGVLFQGSYSVDFPGKKQGGYYVIEGDKSLGLFGKFGHKATVTNSSFMAKYSNDNGDLGSFSLRRP
ncbi:MAG: hypothetical protein CMO61_05965 [Verrucomicrobiales bacterium]|jgi:hypothetical protein|nr:hypothetical protein [Verrucomicrobiales bacterium]|tara:strand:+ start:25281 stop:25721 length:441 start_codon:yes stop_codon:yes gene_type:complete